MQDSTNTDLRTVIDVRMAYFSLAHISLPNKCTRCFAVCQTQRSVCTRVFDHGVHLYDFHCMEDTSSTTNLPVWIRDRRSILISLCLHGHSALALPVQRLSEVVDWTIRINQSRKERREHLPRETARRPGAEETKAKAVSALNASTNTRATRRPHATSAIASVIPFLKTSKGFHQLLQRTGLID